MKGLKGPVKKFCDFVFNSIMSVCFILVLLSALKLMGLF